MYELLFDSKAIESMEKLPKQIRSRLFKKLQETKKNPFRYFEKLEGRIQIESRRLSSNLRY